MNQFKRPTSGRSEWDSPNNTKRVAAIEKIDKMLKDGKNPTSGDFDPVWNKVSKHFRQAQHDLCGYCGEQTKGGGLDHFRPKTMVKRKLLNEGIHDPKTDSVSGREFDTADQPGYYDRAYDWENFVLSCTICNSKWKRNYFPVTRKSVAGKQEEYLGPPVDDEVPQMRSPFADSDPLTEFNINADGLVSALTSGALSTIEVCGLWRESLVSNRKEKYAAAWRTLNDYLRAGTPEQERDAARQDLTAMGGWNRPLACVVRAAAAAKGLDWDTHFASS